MHSEASKGVMHLFGHKWYIATIWEKGRKVTHIGNVRIKLDSVLSSDRLIIEISDTHHSYNIFIKPLHYA